jgi:hypothetical protein
MSITLLGFDEAQRALQQLGREKMNIAIAAGLNRTLVQVDRALKTAMPRALDRPTPFTLNSTRLAKADRNKLRGRLFVMDRQAKYLSTTVRGGRINTLTPIGATTNQYGNLPGKKAERQTLVKIARKLKRGRLGPNGLPKDLFIGTVQGVYGLWQRYPGTRYRRSGGGWTSRKPKLLVRVDENVNRRARFDFFGIAERTVQRRLADDIREAIAREIRNL